MPQEYRLFVPTAQPAGQPKAAAASTAGKKVNAKHAGLGLPPTVADPHGFEKPAEPAEAAPTAAQ